MLRTLGAVLSREVRGLHEAAYLVAFLTLGSQLVALVRDRVFAHQFGAGHELDLFYAAFRVPDTLYALLASLVSVFVLIPFLEAASGRGDAAVRQFLSTVLSFFSYALIVLGAVAWCFAGLAVTFLYPDLVAQSHSELTAMVRIMLLQPLLLGASNLFGAYLQLRGRFVLYGLAPILYNVGIIAGAVALYPLLGVSGLAWGVVLGALLHLGVQAPFVRAAGVLPRFVVPDWHTVCDVVRVSVPRALTLSMQQGVFLVVVACAATLGVGSVAILTLAWNLAAVPLALVGASYSVAAFPGLTRAYARGDHAAFAELVSGALRQVVSLALPVTALFLVLREDIVQAVLGSGAFGRAAVVETGAVLAAFVVSLIAQGISLLLIRVCYAAGKTTPPLIRTALGSAVAVGLALSMGAWPGGFSSLLPGAWAAGVVGVACAFSVGAFVQAVLLVGYVARNLVPLAQGSLGHLARSVAASLACGGVAYSVVHVLGTPSGSVVALGQGAVASMGGVVAWAAILVLLGGSELAALWRTVLRREA